MLKRAPSKPRAPSPSSTTYSGISNYRTESYQPKQRAPSIPIDPKAIARIHYDEMTAYLDNHLAKGERTFFARVEREKRAYGT